MIMLIKIPFIQYLYGIRSMRQTVKEIEVNVAYRWFLGLEMMDKVPHFSTFGLWSADPKRFVYSLKKERFNLSFLSVSISQDILPHTILKNLHITYFPPLLSHLRQHQCF